MSQPTAARLTRTASLDAFTSPAGAISILALDHRDAMRNAYRRAGVDEVTEQTMLDAKAKIITALAPRASAILLDARAAALPRPHHLGLFMPLETQGHVAFAGGRLNSLMVEFGPRQATAAGAHGCKLLLYYRSDHAATAERQLQLAATAAAACHRRGLPLVVEPKVYRLPGEDEGAYRQKFGRLVVSAARDLAQSTADLLKLQYPGDAGLCGSVTAAADPLPWTLLGGEIAGETFEAQLRDACRAGASGFIAGRAIWGGALPLATAARTAWLAQRAAPLFDRLCTITDTDARRIA
jgi:tagatose-1,6-bisphosphate aldolase